MFMCTDVLYPTCFVFLSESLRESKSSLSQSTLGLALERGFGSQTTLSGTEYRPAMDELEEAITLSNMATPKQGKKLHIPVVRIHDAQVRKTFSGYSLEISVVVLNIGLGLETSF